MRCLVIGGTGFIGARVARWLAGAGHAVAVLHRGETRADLPGSIRHLHADRHALTVARPAIERFAPDVVLDVIPYTEAEAAATADFFAGRAGRLVVLSSGDVYRTYDGLRGASDHPPDPAPLAEDAPLRATRYPYRPHADGPDDWTYHYDKILVEEAARSPSPGSLPYAPW